MFNPRSYAVSIEHILSRHGLCSVGDAGEIEKAPIAFLDAALLSYEKTSEKNLLQAAPFWDKYADMKSVSMMELGEVRAAALVTDVRAVFE